MDIKLVVLTATEIEIAIVILAACIALLVGALGLARVIVVFALDHSFPGWREYLRKRTVS